MTEHHGLDLDAINAASGGHSIFAPSGSHMWLTCSGSLIPNILAPDDAGEDAAYGTVGHEVGEEWLLRINDLRDGLEPITEDMIDEARPDYLIGKVRIVKERTRSFAIHIDEEMLAHVARYIQWCVDLPGEHYIETRVDFSRLTPIPDQGGTCDHAACSPGLLIGTDLKMGQSPLNIVYAAEDIDDPRALITQPDGTVVFNGNPQVLIYLLGFFYRWDHKYNFQEIVVRIAQPRLDHFHEWTTTREELLKFADYVKVRAHDAWVPNAPRTPSKKGCRWCRVKGTCAAILSWKHQATDGIFDAVADAVGEDGVIEGVFSVVDSKDMELAKRELDLSPEQAQLPEIAMLSTAQMAKILEHRKVFEDWMKAIHEELTSRAIGGEEIPGFKVVVGKEGNRKFVVAEEDPTWLPDQLAFVGLEGDDALEKKIVSPAQAEARLKTKYGLRAKVAASLIAHLVVRDPGKRTLVPSSDKREEIEDVGSVFDDVSGAEDEI